jgi:hypothetical protein
MGGESGGCSSRCELSRVLPFAARVASGSVFGRDGIVVVVFFVDVVGEPQPEQVNGLWFGLFFGLGVS